MTEIRLTSPDLIPEELLLEADPSMDRIRQYLIDSLCFVATIQNNVVGVCVLKHIDSHRCELFNIAVSPEHQKQGIGSRLLRYALEHLKQRNVKYVELGTGTFGYQLAFYHRFGFRVDSIHKDYFLDNYDEPVFDHGIQLKDMLRLVLKL